MRLHEPLANAIAARLSSGRVTPNILTICALPPALLAGGCAAMGWFVAAALLWGLSGVLDLLDGALARVSDRKTRFGALLDSSLDRVADACVPVGLVVFYAPHGAVAALPALALLASVWISYIRARAQSLDLQLPRLWMRREDRFVALLLALLAAPWVGTGAAIPAPLLAWVMGLVAGLGFVAGTAALLSARKLDRPDQPPGGDTPQ